MDNFGLYVILTAPEIPHIEVARICVDCGVRILQLREKNMPDCEHLRLAEGLMKITRDSETLLFINDRPDLARIAGSDGLHLGQDDIPPDAARSIIGDTLRLGLSTHSGEQVLKALGHFPDYIGFGPVFATPTKAVPDPVTGLEALGSTVRQSPVPVVAIGGINAANIDSVLETGARNIAMVREFMNTRHPAPRIRHAMRRIEAACSV